MGFVVQCAYNLNTNKGKPEKKIQDSLSRAMSTKKNRLYCLFPRTNCTIYNGIVGKAYRHEIGFFTTAPLILIIFLKPTLVILLHVS